MWPKLKKDESILMLIPRQFTNLVLVLLLIIIIIIIIII